jgi:predicted MFS family arabinose efflux permease
LFQIATFVLASSIIFAIRIAKKRAPLPRSKFSFSGIREITKFPHVIIVLIYCAASFGMILAIHPAFLNDRNMSATAIEILYFVFGVSRVITLALAERLARHITMTVLASTLCISIGLLMSFFSESIIQFGIAMAIMGFGFSVIFPLTLEIILRKVRRETSGVIIGAYETTFGIGWAVGPIVSGMISEFSGNATPYLVFFAIGIGISAMSVIKKRSLEPVDS